MYDDQEHTNMANFVLNVTLPSSTGTSCLSASADPCDTVSKASAFGSFSASACFSSAVVILPWFLTNAKLVRRSLRKQCKTEIEVLENHSLGLTCHWKKKDPSCRSRPAVLCTAGGNFSKAAESVNPRFLHLCALGMPCCRSWRQRESWGGHERWRESR